MKSSPKYQDLNLPWWTFEPMHKQDYRPYRPKHKYENIRKAMDFIVAAKLSMRPVRLLEKGIVTLRGQVPQWRER